MRVVPKETEILTVIPSHDVENVCVWFGICFLKVTSSVASVGNLIWNSSTIIETIFNDFQNRVPHKLSTPIENYDRKCL